MICYHLWFAILGLQIVSVFHLTYISRLIITIWPFKVSAHPVLLGNSTKECTCFFSIGSVACIRLYFNLNSPWAVYTLKKNNLQITTYHAILYWTKTSDNMPRKPCYKTRVLDFKTFISNLSLCLFCLSNLNQEEFLSFEWIEAFV